MRSYLALYVVVFVVSALIAYAVLGYSYTPMRTVTVVTATTRIITETRIYTVQPALHAYPTTTTAPKIFEAPRACSIAIPTTTEIPSTARKAVPLMTTFVAVQRTVTEFSTEVRELSEKNIVSAYSVSRGVVKLLNASIRFATVNQTRSYIAIDLLLTASIPSKVLVTSAYIEPLPLPFGWNGSGWTIGFDEKHCLRRLSALPPYSYRVEPRVVELEPGKASSLHIELLFRGPIYGRYILIARLSTGDILELRFTSPDYRDPTTPPPRELVELAKTCGYGIGG